MSTNIDPTPPPIEQDPSTFRRVKPLPKRRRTNALNVLRTDYDPSELTSFSFQDPQALAALADLHARPYFSQLNAHQVIRDLFNTETPDPRDLADFTGLYSNPAVAPIVAVVPDDDDQLESDYVDHLQLPANTKKRKVPGLNRPSSLSGDAISGVGLGLSLPDMEQPANEGALQLAAHRLLVDGPEDLDSLQSTIHASSSDPPRRNPRESLVTRAGLQQKSLISTRKKQFAAVLEDFPESGSLALEQALSARYPQLEALFDMKQSPYLRNSKKVNLKVTTPQMSPAQYFDDKVEAPTSEFTFSCPCTTSERAASIREEAVRLQARFEEELTRQATRVVEAAAKVAAAAAESSPKNRKRAAGANYNAFPLPPRLDSDSLSGDQALVGKGRQKKKKRSALANASNPHHLRNYVPSRLPQQPPPLTQAALSSANFLSPPPLRFLSAQIPPRRRKHSDVSPSGLVSNLTAPMDEWICALCEYDLFYGDEARFRKGVKNRKKILSRRRRARERAAAAASGVAPTFPERHAPAEYPDVDGAKAPQSSFSNQNGTRKDSQISGADASDTLK